MISKLMYVNLMLCYCICQWTKWSINESYFGVGIKEIFK